MAAAFAGLFCSNWKWRTVSRFFPSPENGGKKRLLHHTGEISIKKSPQRLTSKPYEELTEAVPWQERDSLGRYPAVTQKAWGAFGVEKFRQHKGARGRVLQGLFGVAVLSAFQRALCCVHKRVHHCNLWGTGSTGTFHLLENKLPFFAS